MSGCEIYPAATTVLSFDYVRIETMQEGNTIHFRSYIWSCATLSFGAGQMSVAG